MQVTLPLGGGVVERDIPQRIPGQAVGEALPDGESLVIDVTENSSPVAAWLRLGDRTAGLRLYEETNATGDFTLTDAELDDICPPGSSVGYEVWTQVGTPSERIRYQGVIRRARSLANANPDLSAPTITAPTVTLQSQTALAATFLVDWKAPGGGTVETRTRTVSDGTTTVAMTGDGTVTFDKAAASRTVTATDSVSGPAGSNSAQATATIPALAAAPALASPQTVSLEGGQTPATYDLAQHLTGGIAPLAWETVENDSAGKVTRSGSVLTITQDDYSATVQARVADAAERSAEITVQITVSEAVVIVRITWDPQPSLDPLTEGDTLADAVNDGTPSHTSGAPTIIATIINPDHETAVAGQAYTVRQIAEAPDGTLGSATSAAVTAVAQDQTPDAFDFADETDADTETAYTSGWVAITDTDAVSPISITGGEYQIADDASGTNAGGWTSASGTIAPGKFVQARGTSSAAAETAVNVVLTIGGVSGTFTITTAAAALTMAFSEDVNGDLLWENVPPDATGELTISSPAERAGIYSYDVSYLAAGPMNWSEWDSTLNAGDGDSDCLPSLVYDDLSAGTTVSADIGLWVHDDAQSGYTEAATVETSPDGETWTDQGATYAIQAGDLGTKQLRAKAVVSTSAGSRTAYGDAVAIPGSAALTIADGAGKITILTEAQLPQVTAADGYGRITILME